MKLSVKSSLLSVYPGIKEAGVFPEAASVWFPQQTWMNVKPMRPHASIPPSVTTRTEATGVFATAPLRWTKHSPACWVRIHPAGTTLCLLRICGSVYYRHSQHTSRPHQAPSCCFCLCHDRERADEFAGTGPHFGIGSGHRPPSAPAAPDCDSLLLLLPQEDRQRRVSTSPPAQLHRRC